MVKEPMLMFDVELILRRQRDGLIRIERRQKKRAEARSLQA
jgi:hypothetical protein